MRKTLFMCAPNAYKDIWTPTTGELLLVKPEPTNIKDKKGVAVLKGQLIVGHVPHNLPQEFTSS